MTRKANPITVGGVVRGTWTIKGDQLSLVWPDQTHSPPREAIKEETSRLAGILGRDLRPTRSASTLR